MADWMGEGGVDDMIEALTNLPSTGFRPALRR